ncbi:uncharacterized protein DNG_09412 [Cephalotrichum gorgonifer]|uniref:PXA domain-containing protein n=1 Tax=Cephalotrichum gorgonifer TaxID=2041049 RepID=A0AAE8SZE3_9PEZI|nr:uncharacterized protein DNG_09412 [Cephalotrichum gorgonifer]
MATQNDAGATPLPLAPGAGAEAPDTQSLDTKEPQTSRDEPIGEAVQKQPHTKAPAPTETRSQLTDSRSDEDLVAKLIQFISTATPNTLGAVAAGLCVATYLVLGRIGLVLIGAFGGVILYISYEASRPEFARAVRGEKGTDTIQRLVQELKETARETAPGAQDGIEDQLVRSFDDFRPKTRDAMKALVDAVIKDYVKWWYGPIVPSDRSFPLASRKLLSSFLLSISNHLSRKRPADVFLDFLTNSTSMVIVFFSELSAAFGELPPDSNVTSIDAVYNYLASNPDSNLASLLNQRQQTTKFHMIAEDLLGYLDRSAHNCEVVRAFLREIFSTVLLESTLRTCSQPEWINGWIVYLLEAGEPDFNQAIDVGMQSGREANPGVLPEIDNSEPVVVPTAKAAVPEGEGEGTRKREPASNHRKKLSKAEEEMEEAIGEMKRLNQMIAEEESMRASQSLDIKRTNENGGEIPGKMTIDTGAVVSPPATSGTTSPPPRPSSDKASVQDNSVDSHSSKGEIVHTPVTPASTGESGSRASSPKQVATRRFTSFDQIVPRASDTDDGDEPRKSPLTLYNATVTVHDDGSNDNGRLWTKPNWDYLIQIEPVSSNFPGWMVARKYADFEPLHEVLRRIANISGATAFTEQHGTLPQWKTHTRESLRREMESYLRDACWYQTLAESESMKRFLDKDQGLPQSENRSSFGFDMFGKNVMDVLTTAPMQGGQAVLGGVTGVLGNIGLGQKKSAPPPKDANLAALGRLSISTSPRVNSQPSPVPSLKGRDSMDSQRSSIISTQPGRVMPMARTSSQFDRDADNDDGRRSRSDRFDSARGSANHSRASSRAPSRAPMRSSSSMSLDGFNLPPVPSDMKDNYEPRPGQHRRSQTTDNLGALSPSMAMSPMPTSPLATSPLLATPPLPIPPKAAAQGAASPPKRSRQYTPLTEQEASVSVELMFAIINELYTLTSAWNIRRTLLGAAKSFLLRPGNPSLTSIRALIQESVLDANTSDSGIAAHLQKIRENALPTEEELAAWPAEMSQEEKDKLRDKARRLLIQSGVPAALTGIMGQAATSEAVGRVFDCLQVEEVARGLMFGIMLQAMRIITH